MKRITSRHNALVVKCRTVARGDDRSMMLLDGAHLVSEALDARVPLTELVVTSEASGRDEIKPIVARATRSGAAVALVSPSVMAAMTPIRRPSGVVALAKRLASAERAYAGPSPLVLVACDVQDPGNIGALVRVAEAAGASGMIAAGVSADPFGWKALRGSMGSAFRLPIAAQPRIEDALEEARQGGCRIVAAVPRGGIPLPNAELGGSLAVFVGGEGPGLRSEVLERADLRVTIPMRPPVESLNTAVTAALVLYEAQRWRTR